MICKRSAIPSFIKVLFVSVAVLVLSASAASFQVLRQTDLVKISENIFVSMAVPGGGAAANAGFVITDKWVCVFDSHLTSLAASELASEIRLLTSLPIRYLVNSHYHGDHTHGNQSLPPYTEVIATHSTWDNLLNKGLPQLQHYQQVLPDQIERLRKELHESLLPERAIQIQHEVLQREQLLNRIADLELVLPGLTIEKSISLWTRNKEVQILHLGRGHTDGDLVLWLPIDRVLFAGDIVFHDMLPNMFDGYTEDWIESLGLLQALRPEVVVPGHGAIGDDSMLSDCRDYLRYLLRTVKANIAQEMNLEEMLDTMKLPVRFQRYRNQELFPSNIDRVYRELLEEAANRPLPPRN